MSKNTHGNYQDSKKNPQHPQHQEAAEKSAIEEAEMAPDAAHEAVVETVEATVPDTVIECGKSLDINSIADAVSETHFQASQVAQPDKVDFMKVLSEAITHAELGAQFKVAAELNNVAMTFGSFKNSINESSDDIKAFVVSALNNSNF